MSDYIRVIAACLLLSGTPGTARADEATDAERQAAIAAAVAAYVKSYGITGGAIAILRGQRLLYSATFGEADIESVTAIDEATRFQLSSTTKLFTGTLMTMLAGDGLVDFAKPVRHYLPQLPPSWSDVLLEDVMTHLSGLPEVLDCGELVDRDAAFLCVTALERPGPRRETFDYNQTNYMLAMMVIESVTGDRFDDVLAERITGPAGMTATVWNGSSRDDLTHRAAGYYPNEAGGVAPRDYDFPGFLMSAAGLNVTLSDMVAFARALDGGKLMDASWKQRMWRAPVTTDGTASMYAIGWDLRKLGDGGYSAGHEGGSLTTFRVYPGVGLSVTVLLNGVHEYFGLDAFADLLAETAEPGILPADWSLAYRVRLRYLQTGIDGALETLTDEGCANVDDPGECDEILDWLAQDLEESGRTADAAILRGRRQQPGQ